MDRNRRLLWIIVTLALILRIAATWVWRDRLNEDVDGYRGIAEMLAAGQGYADPENGRPTAFRPPLFPLALAACAKLGGGNAGIAALQILLGTLTVLVGGLLANKLRLRVAWLVPLLVALDPLQLAYTPRVMTEIASGLTLALLLWTADSANRNAWRLRSLAICGVTFGLAALCRPTVWALLPVVMVCLAFAIARDRELLLRVVKRSAVFGGCVAVVVMPWLIRNHLVIQAPVFTTTHGGYTLLLSNNPEFYGKIVLAKWGTVWDSIPWQKRLREDLARSGVQPKNERAKDRWMYARAITNIRSDPAGFLGSCWLKLLRFWSVAPLAAHLPALVTWSIRGFYIMVFLGAVMSLRFRTLRPSVCVFALAWCLLLAFTGVHLFYWANTRMRAPLVVAIALLSARGWAGTHDEPHHQDHS